MKKTLPILLLGLLVISGFATAVTTNTQSLFRSIQESVPFSDPLFIRDENNYISIHLTEATSYITSPGDPKLPVYTKLFTLPFGTIINDVSFESSSEKTLKVIQEIIPASQPVPVSSKQSALLEELTVKNDDIYKSMNAFPSERLNYQVGTGLKGNNRVVLVSVQYYPFQYSPLKNTLYFTPEVHITITYEEPKQPMIFSDDYDLFIIAPFEYSEALQPLLTHKAQYGIKPLLVTKEDIVAEYPGRDNIEKIKYSIKDAIETHGVTSVLLVGGVEKIPIRNSYVSLWGYGKGDMITDLYYADIYNAQGNFSCWDTNNNDKFGEASDEIDMYPDVHLGRLSCDSVDEVHIVVDKIIHYETETYGADWFNTMILIGGNTFRWTPRNDGEVNNAIIMGIMSQFTPKIIWMSKGNYNPLTITKAITEGAGFLDYSGHGFEHGMGTYTTLGLRMKYYFTSYIKLLKNGYKLPIMFFDACSVAKLDYVLQDTLQYARFRFIPNLVTAVGINASMRLTCYAWAYLIHNQGGAIATIGATRVAFGGITSGAGKMSFEFFNAYKDSEYLGEMMTQMQNQYITDVPGDAFTVQEFILLGDPSLKIGGYPLSLS